MSLFSGVEKKVEAHLLESAIEHLGKDGHTGVAGIGDLQYDYDTNSLTMQADPKILKRIKESWEKYH